MNITQLTNVGFSLDSREMEVERDIKLKGELERCRTIVNFKLIGKVEKDQKD